MMREDKVEAAAIDAELDARDAAREAAQQAARAKQPTAASADAGHAPAGADDALVGIRHRVYRDRRCRR